MLIVQARSTTFSLSYFVWENCICLYAIVHKYILLCIDEVPTQVLLLAFLILFGRIVFVCMRSYINTSYYVSMRCLLKCSLSRFPIKRDGLLQSCARITNTSKVGTSSGTYFKLVHSSGFYLKPSSISPLFT